MAWEVLITDSALSDLREIVEFIAQDDPQAAERMGNRLVARALDLATMPERHAYHDATRGIRKFPVLPFLVFYYCDQRAQTVSILHFWHGARQWPEFG
jgi:plasmid stabilization system protein ParE